MRVVWLASILLLACRTQTVPISRMPAYAANRPVLTEEGYALTIADGGNIELSPRDDTPCLAELDPPAGVREVSRVVPVADTDFCRAVKLRSVRRVEAGPLLRFHSYERTIEVDPRLVDAVRVTSASQEPAPFAPRTRVRSPGMIAAGSLVMGLGAAISLAGFLSGGTDVGPYVAVTAPLFVVGVGHSAGIGIPLIVLGSRPVRQPQAQQPPVLAVDVGDIGLRWSLE